ncbi:MAG: DUF2905 domain-containing protein [Chloroflexi bacterium]|nr:DUF2905 domain-containing protein [Chloroflexota bacterium]MDL1943281.1 DUF2905 domain-containing protein [Chloroflexi bacterium CFX2]
MESLSRYLMLFGILLFLIGGGVYLAAKFGIPLGRLPGDIRIEGENGSFYFPITTSILISVILTVILNLISRFLNK